MEHEGIGVSPEFRYDEGDTLRHEPGDEGDVAGEAVELGDDDGALAAAGRGAGYGQLRTAVERVRTLAALRFGECRNEVEALLEGEAGDGLLLSLYPQAGLPLPLGGDPVVGDRRLRSGSAASMLERWGAALFGPPRDVQDLYENHFGVDHRPLDRLKDLESRQCPDFRWRRIAD